MPIRAVKNGNAETCTVAKVFIDTNLLVYTLDRNDHRKQTACRRLLAEAAERHTAVISTQVLQEFYVVATTKLRVEPLTAKQLLHSFSNLEIVTVDLPIIKEAIDIGILHHLSFWDALIIAAAESAGCDRLWTEDLQHGRVIHSVTIHNPILKG